MFRKKKNINKNNKKQMLILNKLLVLIRHLHNKSYNKIYYKVKQNKD